MSRLDALVALSLGALAVTGAACTSSLRSACDGGNVTACVGAADELAAGGVRGRDVTAQSQAIVDLLNKACTGGVPEACRRLLAWKPHGLVRVDAMTGMTLGSETMAVNVPAPGALWTSLEAAEFGRIKGPREHELLVAFLGEFAPGPHAATARRRLAELEYPEADQQARSSNRILPLLQFAAKAPDYGLEQPLLLQLGVDGQPVDDLRKAPGLLDARLKHLTLSGASADDAARASELRGFIGAAAKREDDLSFNEAVAYAASPEGAGDPASAVKRFTAYRGTHPGSPHQPEATSQEAHMALLAAKSVPADTRVDALAAVALAYPGTPSADEATLLGGELAFKGAADTDTGGASDPVVVEKLMGKATKLVAFMNHFPKSKRLPEAERLLGATETEAVRRMAAGPQRPEEKLAALWSAIGKVTPHEAGPLRQGIVSLLVRGVATLDTDAYERYLRDYGTSPEAARVRFALAQVKARQAAEAWAAEQRRKQEEAREAAMPRRSSASSSSGGRRGSGGSYPPGTLEDCLLGCRRICAQTTAEAAPICTEQCSPQCYSLPSAR
jgi:outer membrane protein assembly factor BamD (BamD/ComL family)